MQDLTKGTLSILLLSAASNRFASDIYNTLFRTLAELTAKRNLDCQIDDGASRNEEFEHRLVFRLENGAKEFNIQITGNGTIDILEYDDADLVKNEADPEDEPTDVKSFFFNEKDGVEKVVSDILITIANMDDNGFSLAYLNEIRAAKAALRSMPADNGEILQPAKQ